MTRDHAKPATAPVLDPTILQQLIALGGGDAAGSAAFVREIVALFRDQAPAMLADLVAQLGRDDAPGVAAAAHRLKGCCANIGGAALAARCLGLELEGRGGHLGSRGDAVARELQTLLQATIEALEAWAAHATAA
jgi:HPt (histidine-containing phosphotransfer) domain-containing protein